MSRAVALAALALAACSGPSPVGPDSGLADAGAADGGSFDAGRGWNPNEVSMLFPAPLLPMRDGADGGALIAPDLFHRLGDPDAGLPRLVEAAGGRDLYPELRVVSARLDPCFDGPGPDGGCRRQLRLVAQTYDPALGDYSDAAIHLFYDLDDAAFLDVLARVRALSRQTPVEGPLGLHPVLARDGGMTGPFAEALRGILLDHCSTATLSRFTFMATGRSKNWFFVVLDRGADGGFTPSPIPGAGDGDAFTDQGLTHYRMGIGFNVPWFPDALLTSPATRALSPTAFASAYDQLARLENPVLTRTRDVGCAACHVAESTQVEALRDRDAGAAPATPSGYPVARDPGGIRLGNLHAFSIFNGVPTINARTANETDEVLRFLQSPAFQGALSAADRARLE